MSAITEQEREALAEALPDTLQPVGALLKWSPLMYRDRNTATERAAGTYGQVILDAITPAVEQIVAARLGHVEELIAEAERRGAERVAQAVEAARFEATFEHPVEEMLRKGITSEAYEKGYRKALTRAVRIARSEQVDSVPTDVTEGELATAVWQDFGMVTDERAADDLAAHLLATFRVNRRGGVA